MKILISALGILLSTLVYGQVPQAFKYQAVARSANRELLVNQQINVRITIIDSASGGTNTYSEIHKAGTNQFGLFSINIGEGITSTGVFENILWTTGNKWIKIELDPTGDNNYSDMGTHPLLSVPYALFAGSSANGAEDSTNELQTLSISGHNLSISKGNTIILPYDSTNAAADDSTNELQDLSSSTNGSDVTINISKGTGATFSINDADADSTNELQGISISNDTVFLSKGGFIKLPPDAGNTDNQTLSMSGNRLTISGGNSVLLPTTGTTTPVFDPHFPDGTDSLISVIKNIMSNNPYTVPVGKNFYGYIEAPDPNQYSIIINGQPIDGYNWMNINLKAGDVISTTATLPNYIFVSGYLSPQIRQVVNVQIRGTYYMVPAGRQFFLTWVNITPWIYGLTNGPMVYVNNAAIPLMSLIYSAKTAYVVIDGGGVISTNASVGTNVFINGFLK